MNKTIDRELVMRLHKSDVKSFDTIYQKYHFTLYSNINKLTKNIEVTQDILQDVFVCLWEKRSTIDENKPVLNWLITVSYHKTVNYLKSSLRETARLQALQEKSHAADEQEPNLRDNQLYQLESAVNLLSPQRSKVFNLCKLQGKSYAETAQELNISKYTVKEYLVEAVLHVKEYIKHHPLSSSAPIYASFLALIV